MGMALPVNTVKSVAGDPDDSKISRLLRTRSKTGYPFMILEWGFWRSIRTSHVNAAHMLIALLWAQVSAYWLPECQLKPGPTLPFAQTSVWTRKKLALHWLPTHNKYGSRVLTIIEEISTKLAIIRIIAGVDGNIVRFWYVVQQRLYIITREPLIRFATMTFALGGD